MGILYLNIFLFKNLNLNELCFDSDRGPVVFIVVSRLSFVVRATVIAYAFE